MPVLHRITRVLMWISLAVTLAKLSTDRGGGQYLFTLIGFVVLSTLAPYWLSMRVMPRLPRRWGLALGAAVCVFGVGDITLRTIGFFFPTDSIDGGMAFWMPIYSLFAIPFTTVIAHTFIVAFASPQGTEMPEATGSHEETKERRPTEGSAS